MVAMTPRLLALFAATLTLASADDRWVEYRSGPFHIYSNAGEKIGRERLNQLEQFRWELGALIGNADPQTVWPIRLVLFKTDKQYGPYASPSNLALSRDGWMSAWMADRPLPREWMRDVARQLIVDATRRIPPPVESGLAELLSTLTASGTHITLGSPPPAELRSKDWARMHYLAAREETTGRVKVYVHNLEQSGDLDAASKNAFDKTAAVIEKDVDLYLAAGKFEPIQFSGRAINASKDLAERPMEPVMVQVALADLLLSDPKRLREAQTAYSSIDAADAREGLALIAIAEKRSDEARILLDKATSQGSKSARAWQEASLLEPDPAKARKLLERAAELNSRWAAPHFQMASIDTNLVRKPEEIRKAANLEPRNVGYWRALADACKTAKQFPEAARAWASAERAAATPEERSAIHAARLEAEGERYDAAAAERKRAAEERAVDLERVRQAALAEIHAAEQKVNSKAAPLDPSVQVVPWSEGPQPDHTVSGVLQQVECVRNTLRLIVKPEDAPVVKLAVPDPSKIALVTTGPNTRSLGCGVQKPAPKVKVQYIGKVDSRQGTSGEALTVEFLQ